MTLFYITYPYDKNAFWNGGQEKCSPLEGAIAGADEAIGLSGRLGAAEAKFFMFYHPKRTSTFSTFVNQNSQ